MRSQKGCSRMIYLVIICCTVSLILIFIGTVQYLRRISKSAEHFESKFTVSRVVDIDFDGYFYPPRMKDVDLVARNMKRYEEYEAYYKNSLLQFTPEETNILSMSIDIINQDIIHQTRMLRGIPWKFIKVDHNIEHGYPHTHGEVIVLSQDFFMPPRSKLIQTLIHEKIHVFQRLYPEITDDYIQNVLEFTRYIDKASETLSNILARSRNNPDIKGLYAFQGQYIPVQVYNSDHPTSIADSKVVLYDINKDGLASLEAYDIFDGHIPHELVVQCEHPYEIMAVLIAKVFIDFQRKIKCSNLHPILSRTASWVLKHL